MAGAPSAAPPCWGLRGGAPCASTGSRRALPARAARRTAHVALWALAVMACVLTLGLGACSAAFARRSDNFLWWGGVRPTDAPLHKALAPSSSVCATAWPLPHAVLVAAGARAAGDARALHSHVPGAAGAGASVRSKGASRHVRPTMPSCAIAHGGAAWAQWPGCTRAVCLLPTHPARSNVAGQGGYGAAAEEIKEMLDVLSPNGGGAKDTGERWGIAGTDTSQGRQGAPERAPVLLDLAHFASGLDQATNGTVAPHRRYPRPRWAEAEAMQAPLPTRRPQRRTHCAPRGADETA